MKQALKVLKVSAPTHSGLMQFKAKIGARSVGAAIDELLEGKV